MNPPSPSARPRPPWFIATKTTVTTMTGHPPLPPHGSTLDRGHVGVPSPEDPEGVELPPGNHGPEHHHDDVISDVELEKIPGDDVTTSTTTSTTTTLRPPPWLITNTTKNTTRSTTTSSTTISTPPSTSSTLPAAETLAPGTSLDIPDTKDSDLTIYEDEILEETELDDTTLIPYLDNDDDDDEELFSSSPLSTTSK